MGKTVIVAGKSSGADAQVHSHTFVIDEFSKLSDNVVARSNAADRFRNIAILEAELYERIVSKLVVVGTSAAVTSSSSTKSISSSLSVDPRGEFAASDSAAARSAIERPQHANAFVQVAELR